MMDIEKKSNSLLLSFYKLSYPGILGIPFPDSFESAKEYADMHTYVEREFPSYKHNIVLDKFMEYRKKEAPRIKLSPLVEFFQDNNKLVEKVESILDFGCGDGNTLSLMTQMFPNLNIGWCIDNDLNLLDRRTISEKPNQVLNFCGSVENIVPNNSCDLITIIHTLHHIDFQAQESTVSSLVKKLKEKAFVYIYEDSWSDRQILPSNEEVDLIFNGMNTENKKELFTSNEFWSNNWCYNRHLPTAKEQYRSIEDWTDLLRKLGLNIIDKGVIGFDKKRLHGVPSMWIIGKRKAAGRSNAQNFKSALA